MSTLEEIESAVERLPFPEQEALLRFIAMRLNAPVPAINRPYRIKTHPGGVRPGIDPDKLGQLPDDF